MYPIALQIAGELGGVDVLVNNASDLGPTPLALLADTQCEDLERALATNLLGPFRLTKALRPGNTQKSKFGCTRTHHRHRSSLAPAVRGRSRIRPLQEERHDPRL